MMIILGGTAIADEAFLETEDAQNSFMADEISLNAAQHINANSGKVRWPPKKPLKGSKTIACVGIQWQGRDSNPAADATACEKLNSELNEYYFRNSRGKFSLVSKYATELPVPLDCVRVKGLQKKARENEEKMVALVKSTYKADYYVVPQLCRKTPHAGGHVAVVHSATNLQAAGHEVGHLLGLQHAGAYVYEEGAEPKLLHYGDRKSTMGKVYSRFITAPQYYWQGWLNPDEIAMYNHPVVDEYELKRIDDLNDKNAGLLTVIVPPTRGHDQHYAFISSTGCISNAKRTCISIHLANRGASYRVAEFENEYYDSNFTGLHVKLLRNEGKKVVISVDYEADPY